MERKKARKTYVKGEREREREREREGGVAKDAAGS